MCILPSLEVLRVWHEFSFRRGPGAVSDPEEGVGPGAVVGEALDEQGRFVHDEHGALDSMRVLRETADQAAVFWSFGVASCAINCNQKLSNQQKFILQEIGITSNNLIKDKVIQ